jgi:hypothetical protein
MAHTDVRPQQWPGPSEEGALKQICVDQAGMHKHHMRGYAPLWLFMVFAEASWTTQPLSCYA